MQRSDPLRYVRIRYGVLRWADLHRIEPPPKETFLIYDLIELHYDKECLGADIIVIASDGSEMTCGTRFMLLVNTNYYNSSRTIMKAFFWPFFSDDWVAQYEISDRCLYFIRVPHLVNCSSRRWSFSASTDVANYGSQPPSYLFGQGDGELLGSLHLDHLEPILCFRATDYIQ